MYAPYQEPAVEDIAIIRQRVWEEFRRISVELERLEKDLQAPAAAQNINLAATKKNEYKANNRT